MKRTTVMFMGVMMAVLFGATYLYAQNPTSDQKMMRHEEHFGPGKSLSLTPEQRAKFQEMRRNFRRDNAQLIGAIVTKRIELQSLWTDPKADPNAIREKAKELRDLQDQLRDKGFSSMLEARSVLTPEQIARWNPPWIMWGPGMRGRPMMGREPMMGMMEHGGPGMMGRPGPRMGGRMERGGYREGYGMCDRGEMMHGTGGMMGGRGERMEHRGYGGGHDMMGEDCDCG